MGDLDGRIALVTGAARGIGQACAYALAKAGARVIVTDIEAPKSLAADIGGIALSLDVTQQAAWTDIMAAAQQQLGGLDILVNNAGILMIGAIEDMSLSAWRRMHAINVEGVFLGCKHATPLIAQRAARWDGGGSIINMSSIGGLRGGAHGVAYSASKGAVRLMTKSLALELADRRIRVNSVHPGLVDTAMGQQIVEELSQMKGANHAPDLAPPPRAATPANIADGVVFLASDRAAFMTGTEFVIDGGLTA